MRFQKSQPTGAATMASPTASTGPLKTIDASSPGKKAHAHEMHERSWQHFERLRTAMARTGRYEEGALHKAGVGVASS
jgi:uncharacterized membrane protein